MGIKSPLFGRTHTEETKKAMSLSRGGENNLFFGKKHSEESKNLMRDKALKRVHSTETKDKMSKSHGKPVNIHEKTSAGFVLVDSFFFSQKSSTIF